MHMRRTIVASLLALGLIVVAVGAAVAQPPPIPSDYLGTVTIGGKPAPDGATVQAQIDTYLSSLVTVANGKYTFLIVGPLTATPQGKTITFLINGAIANETSTFEMGTTKTLNLTIASAPAEPPVVPTATAPPRPATPRPTVSAAPKAAATPTPASDAESSAMTWVVVVVVIAALAGLIAMKVVKR